MRAIAGQGLEGDRYAIGEGHLTSGLAKSFKVLNGSSPTPVVHFEIGEVVMRYDALCRGCGRIGTLSGKRGFAAVFGNGSGVRASIISTGIIQVGDPIRVVSII